MKKLEKLAGMKEVYYVRTIVARGMLDESFGFMPNPTAEQKEVSVISPAQMVKSDVGNGTKVSACIMKSFATTPPTSRRFGKWWTE